MRYAGYYCNRIANRQTINICIILQNLGKSSSKHNLILIIYQHNFIYGFLCKKEEEKNNHNSTIFFSGDEEEFLSTYNVALILRNNSKTQFNKRLPIVYSFSRCDFVFLIFIPILGVLVKFCCFQPNIEDCYFHALLLRENYLIHPRYPQRYISYSSSGRNILRSLPDSCSSSALKYAIVFASPSSRDTFGSQLRISFALEISGLRF